MITEVKHVDGTAVLSLAGEIDLQQSPRVRKALLAELEARYDVLVDLGGVSYIDSSGVASLVEAFQTARKYGVAFGLTAVSAAAMRVLQLARLDRVFVIHDSTAIALKAQKEG